MNYPFIIVMILVYGVIGYVVGYKHGVRDSQPTPPQNQRPITKTKREMDKEKKKGESWRIGYMTGRRETIEEVKKILEGIKFPVEHPLNCRACDFRAEWNSALDHAIRVVSFSLQSQDKQNGQ